MITFFCFFHLANVIYQLQEEGKIGVLTVVLVCVIIAATVGQVVALQP